MTHKLTRKAHTFHSVVLSIAALSVLIAMAALAQMAGTDRLTTNLHVASVSGYTGVQSEERAQDAGALFFLPAVGYGSGGADPTAVVVTDVNGDDTPDTLVANQSSNTVGVLLGKGDGTFQAAVAYSSGGLGPVSVAVGDANGDGEPDLVVANYSGNTVGVLLGNGDGTFRPTVAYNSGASNPGSVAIADVNGDGKLDLLVAHIVGVTGTCNGGCIGILLGNGDGTFQSAVTYSSGAFQARYIAVADVNSDGKVDLVVTNRCRDNVDCTSGGGVDVLLGNGDGTFGSPITYSSDGFDASSVAVADVNGDGKPDLMVTDVCANAGCKGLIAMLLGNGDGTFQPAVVRSSGGYFAHLVAVTDVNGDGRQDVAVANGCTVSISKNCGTGAVGVLLGYGNGIFQQAVSFSSGGFGTASLAVQDVNSDDKPDLVATNAEALGKPDGSVAFLINETAASIPTTTTLLTSPNPSKYQQAVTFTAMVSSASGTPNGTVIFYDGLKKNVGHASLADGSATISISSLSASSHAMRAAYLGSGSFGLSVSAAVTQVVEKYPTTTTLSTSPNPSQFGQAVTFTAQVTGSGPLPTGKVKFLDGATAIGSATLSGGTATLIKSNLKVGTHPISAQYLGNAASATSTSSVVKQVVR